jgi:hypothetical protein
MQLERIARGVYCLVDAQIIEIRRSKGSVTPWGVSSSGYIKNGNQVVISDLTGDYEVWLQQTGLDCFRTATLREMRTALASAIAMLPLPTAGYGSLPRLTPVGPGLYRAVDGTYAIQRDATGQSWEIKELATGAYSTDHLHLRSVQRWIATKVNGSPVLTDFSDIVHSVTTDSVGSAFSWTPQAQAYESCFIEPET